MSEMVERVARAIACVNRLSVNRPNKVSEQQKIALWDSLSPETKNCVITEARVAIEAMRNPTEAMDNAGLDSPDATYCDRCMQLGKTGHQHPGSIWRAMIDEALK